MINSHFTTAWGFGVLGPSERAQGKNEGMPAKEDQVQSVTTSDSSQKTVVRS